MEEGDTRWRNVLTAAALRLEGDVDEAKGSATGTLHGFPLELRLTTRGSGSAKTKWTEVDALLTLPAEFVMFIRPQSRLDSFLVRRGLAVDVVLDDPAFDKAFLVEAAPAEAIHRMLDDHTRSRLLMLRPDSVESCDVGLRLSKEGWESGSKEIRQLLELAALLARRLHAAFQELERAGRAPGGLYRGRPNAQLDLERSAQKAHVLQVRGRRSLIFSVLFVAAFITFLAVVIMRPWR